MAVLVALAATWLAGCAMAPLQGDNAEVLRQSAWARASQPDVGVPAQDWTHQRYGNRKATRYYSGQHQGRPAVQSDSDGGNSTLRLRLPALPVGPGDELRFSWFVPALNPLADMQDAEADDAVVRVMLTFDGDRRRMSRRDHLLSELVQLVTGEPLPYATLMYVWDAQLPVGTVLPSPHSARIRKLVVESGTAGLLQWRDHRRDIAADFRLVFGEAPGPLTGMGVMTDANNTGYRSKAWFGPLRLHTGRGGAQDVALD